MTPEIVTRLAATVGGTVLAWHEYDDHFVIVMVDGRKIIFGKMDASQAGNSITPDDIKEPVREGAARPRKSSKTRRNQ
jgi:hypothetical protein